MGHVFIFLTIAFTIYGQLILKRELLTLENLPSGPALAAFFVKLILTNPYVLSGFVSAFLASLCWMAAMSRFELSYAYPFMSLNFVFVVLLSWWLFSETLDAAKLVGLALICSGVLVVGRSG